MAIEQHRMNNPRDNDPVAQDLPADEKGPSTGRTIADVGKRNLPQQHGGELRDDGGYDEGGLRGSRDLGDANSKGHGGGRGKN